ncbi:MAG: c-type cytochrome [Cyanobacteria bacterium REEB67]|nr:c-type cytochrome [Cyanobacteria bacterium REEB67]
MVSFDGHKKLNRFFHSKHLLGLASLAAFGFIFGGPMLSGNHACPVLQQQDMENGPSARAVPAFARKYNVDCTYCHTVWPQLNRTGYIFRRLGYRMPYEVPKSGVAPSAALPPAVSAGLNKGVNNAVNQSANQIAAGQKVFQEMQCFTCHANGGNLINPTKPIKGSDFQKKYPEDKQIATIIRGGITGTAMPAYGKDRVSDEQLGSLIAYVRSLTQTD